VRKSRKLKNIQHTYVALKEHIKRASYQAYCRNQALVHKICQICAGRKNPQDGSHFGLTLLESSADTCCELIHCGCTEGCRGRCKYIKAALKCAALFSCGGVD